MIKINQNVSIDTSITKKENGKTYARLICTESFVSQGRLIKEGALGAWVRIKKIHLKNKKFDLDFSSHKLELGKNSWLEPGFTATDAFDSHVNGKVFIGENTFIGGYTQIGNNVVIGNNCYIGYAARINNDSRICDDCYLEPSTQIGKNVYIGNNTEIGKRNLDGSLIGFSCYIGVSPNHNKLFRKKRLNPHNLIQERKYIINTAKRKLAERYYNTKRTIIGEKVRISTDCKIEVGSVIGDEAALGRFAHILKNGRIASGSTVQNKEVIKYN